MCMTSNKITAPERIKLRGQRLGRSEIKAAGKTRIGFVGRLASQLFSRVLFFADVRTVNYPFVACNKVVVKVPLLPGTREGRRLGRGGCKVSGVATLSFRERCRYWENNSPTTTGLVEGMRGAQWRGPASGRWGRKRDREQKCQKSIGGRRDGLRKTIGHGGIVLEGSLARYRGARRDNNASRAESILRGKRAKKFLITAEII